MKEVLVGSNVPFHHATLKGLSFFAWLFSVQFSWASKKDLFYVRKLLGFFSFLLFLSVALLCYNGRKGGQKYDKGSCIVDQNDLKRLIFQSFLDFHIHIH